MQEKCHGTEWFPIKYAHMGKKWNEQKSIFLTKWDDIRVFSVSTTIFHPFFYPTNLLLFPINTFSHCFQFIIICVGPIQSHWIWLNFNRMREFSVAAQKWACICTTPYINSNASNWPQVVHWRLWTVHSVYYTHICMWRVRSDAVDNWLMRTLKNKGNLMEMKWNGKKKKIVVSFC